MTGRFGVWLGVDVGSVRIGVARCDPDGILATPLDTVARDVRNGSDLRRLAELVAEYEVAGVVVGLPVTLRGEHGAAARLAGGFADQLRSAIAPVPVELSDERFTTVTAGRKLSQAGVRAKASRAMIDTASAVEILQVWLDGHPSRTPGGS